MNDIISINKLYKKYNTKEGEINTLNDISFALKKGEIISIIGPSGCGKSTLLSIISGLEKDYSGNIIKKNDLKIAYMLQSDALLPFLTIYENALLGLKITKQLSKKNIDYVNYLLKLYNLEEFKNNYPKSLSGGMRQRIALIRTLALKPDLLLLDEPFCALDQQTRMIISDDVYKIVKKKNISVILVTHNIEEAITFSDKIILLSKRPSKIKKIIDININNKFSIYERKKDNKFNEYFDLIWKDLDINE